MAQFVLVASGVSNVAFEKALEIKIKSGDRVRFVPQGVQANPSGAVISQAMSSVKPANNQPEVLNSVRFEWDENGHSFGAEIVSALAEHHRPSKSESDAPAA